MRRLALLFLAGLQVARARRPGFSVFDDLLAHPQYELEFSNNVVSEQEAAALAKQRPPQGHPAYTATFATTGDLALDIQSAQDAPPQPLPPNAAAAADASSTSPLPSTYEYMNLDASTRYLCAIPVVALPDSSPSTPEPNEAARDVEARELERASERGWQLLSGLQAHCLFFMAGWWSYSFCGAREVVQFHALPRLPNGATAPAQDPNTAAYVLGQLAAPAGDKRGDEWNQEASTDWQPTGENRLVHFKADQRYLVQKLGSGTVCDVTGRDRTIEIQYHCVPGLKNDRIAWIKEVTTCSYQMVVNTPRLCEEPAFLPPPEVVANTITCRPVVTGDVAEHPRRTLSIDDATKEGDEAAETADDVQAKTGQDAKPNPASPWKGINVGGVVIGDNRVLQRSDAQQKSGKGGLPAWWLGAQQREDVYMAPVPIKKAKKSDEKDGAKHAAAAEDDKVEFELHLTAKELEMLGLDVDNIRNLNRQLQEMTTESGLEIDMVRSPDGTLEYRVRLGEEEGEGEGKRKGKVNGKGKGGSEKEGKHQHALKDGEGDEGNAVGSQEQFYDAA